MNNITTTGEASNTPLPIELWERKTVLAYFGGDKPLHVSTLYRGMTTGIYPKPVNTSGNTALAGSLMNAISAPRLSA